MKKDVILLIEDNIINAKLMRTLSGIGIDASPYSVNSERVIFKLIGIESEHIIDSLYGKYYKMVKKGESIDFLNSREELENQAKKIYRFLLKYRDKPGFIYK